MIKFGELLEASTITNDTAALLRRNLGEAAWAKGAEYATAARPVRGSARESSAHRHSNPVSLNTRIICGSDSGK
jgi:hypothetical protein